MDVSKAFCRLRYSALSLLLLVALSGARADLEEGLTIAPRDSHPGQVEVRWSSETGKRYELGETSTLTGFGAGSFGLEATPPENVWWFDTSLFDVRFFRVAELSPEPPEELLVNGDFSAGFSPWLTSVNVAAAASFDASSGELVVDITNGGTAAFHIQLLQPGFSVVNGEFYTFKFDARSVGGPRTIQARVQSTVMPNSNVFFVANPVNLTTTMQTFTFSFTMADPTAPSARVAFNLGNNNNDVIFDNISLTAGVPDGDRAAAFEVNRRLAGGNNFAAFMAVPGWGAPEDYALLNSTNHAHCRIGYKLDEVAGAAPGYTIPTADLDEIQALVDFCIAEGLIAVVDPVHDWANGPGFTPPGDLPKLAAIWQQVAARLANYPTDMVIFEIMNEPNAGDDVGAIISTGLAAIRGVAGNEERIVIVSGDGFSTRQAIIDALDDDVIPTNDDFLIATFHYYDPFTFTRQGDTAPPQVNWGSAAEFDAVGTAFDAVVTANNSWATRNGTDPLPIYLGEFGVDNAAPTADRKAWLSWIRLQAEARGFSWCHWLMYNDIPTSKGLGPWTAATRNDPTLRTFQADAVEAMMTRWEAEDGGFSGGVTAASDEPGHTGTGYAEFPVAMGSGIYVEINGYIPRTDTYSVEIRYASAVDRDVTLTTLNDVGSVVQSGVVTFPATENEKSWATLVVPMSFEVGEDARLRIIADPEEGPLVDYVRFAK